MDSERDMVPRVSVVIPVYKVEKYLDRCVESVLGQTLRDIEIILVDDGSPDRCPELCDAYVAKYPNIKVIHKQNAGLGMACNSGIEVATGRYIAFLDSDDWADPDMYATMLSAAEKYGADMVFTGLRRVNENGEAAPMDQAEELRIYDTRDKIREFAYGMIASPVAEHKERQVQMSAKVVMYSREMLMENNIRFESERKLISEDLFFNQDCLAHAGTVVELPNTFYNYFINSGSLTTTVRTDRFEKAILIREELLHRYNDESKEYKDRVNRFFIGYGRTAILKIVQSPGFSIIQKLHLISEITNHPIWLDIQSSYPIENMPTLHKIFFKAIVYKLNISLFLFSKLKS